MDDRLNADLSLDKIAAIAGYCAFHFHRVFKLITSEPQASTINRKRIEPCAAQLMHKPELSVAEFFLDQGFNSAAAFSRSFKKFYGVSPVRFRESVTTRNSKIRQAKSKNGQHHLVIDKYLCSVEEHLKWLTMHTNIEIKKLPEMKLAGITSIGLQNIAGSYEKLVKWSAPKGLLNDPDVKTVTIYHDSAKTTASDKVRISVCVLLKETVKVYGDFKVIHLKQDRCIIAALEIGLADFEQAWKSLIIWMKEKGYQKADGNPFEIYHNNYQEHPDKKGVGYFCISIIE
jgi:AraC family transcriptional regulator